MQNKRLLACVFLKSEFGDEFIDKGEKTGGMWEFEYKERFILKNSLFKTISIKREGYSLFLDAIGEQFILKIRFSAKIYKDKAYYRRFAYNFNNLLKICQ